MKITLEQTNLDDLEIIIRGDLSKYNSKIQSLIAELNKVTSSLDKLFLYKDEKQYLYETDNIEYFESSRNKVFAHVKAQCFEVHYKLYELVELLSQKGFVQIGKSLVVNVNAVFAVEAEFSGNYTAILKDGKTKLTISRNYMKSFKNYIMGVD